MLTKTVSKVLVVVPKVIARRNSDKYVDKALRGEVVILNTTYMNSSVARPNVSTQ